MRGKRSLSLWFIFFWAMSCHAQPVAAIDLRLPTENHHLFTGELDRFYMYVDRDFEGQRTQPWEAGSYGFVRTAVRVGEQVVLTKFHEGIDISPIKRDAAGVPLDLVSSIADGRVVYVSPLAGRSNYGKYVVVEHRWENSSIYSLYAHLAEINCQPGDVVKAGSLLGVMGYTGAGITRVRAHVHLEIAMLMSLRFDDWNNTTHSGLNPHGLFNGMNLCGADAARFFLEHRANPQLKFSEFVAKTPVYFKVTTPGNELPDFVKRHPWILRGDAQQGNSWEISMSSTGLPLAFQRSSQVVDSARVTAVRPSNIAHQLLTRGLIQGKADEAKLSRGGQRLVALLMDDFPISKPTPTTSKSDEPSDP
ncbi:MAG: M23 family metallopeptidase [Verrucomicrobia bacterium]|nr:MAG: M23 family metallopeptidase [Verrucomicrobiota bacterium]